jgi:K+-sensing histidine kinase KdpD
MRRTFRSVALPLIGSSLLVASATVSLIAVGRFFDLSLTLVPLIYLIPVIIAATRWGRVPALVTASACAATADFFFYEPYYTFWISDPHQVVDLMLFLVAAIVTGNLAARLRWEVDRTHRRELEVRELYDFSRRLAACYTIGDLYSALQDFISIHLGRPVALIGAAIGSGRHPLPDVSIPDEVSRQGREILAAGQFQSRLIADPATRDAWLIRPLSSDAREYGVIAVNLGPESHDLGDASRHQIETVLADVTDTLNRLNIAKTIRNATLRSDADRLKDLLIGSVSHALRSPLASILGSSGILLDVPEIQRNEGLSALAQATHAEAARLSGHVQKLLHATRVTADGTCPRLSWIDPVDLVNAAVADRGDRLSRHRIDVALEEDLPLIEADTALIEQALGELLENAAKYSPAASRIKVSARCDDGYVVLAVSDQGAGLTTLERSQLFDRPFRGNRHLAKINGSGLGLWLVQRCVAASGGTVHATSEGESRGTTVSIYLPAGKTSVAEVVIGELE